MAGETPGGTEQSVTPGEKPVTNEPRNAGVGKTSQTSYPALPKRSKQNKRGNKSSTSTTVPGTPRSGSKRPREEVTPDSVEGKLQDNKRIRSSVVASYSVATSCTKMPIVREDYPGMEISEEQFLQIQTTILDMSLGQTSIQPHFTGIRLEQGAVMLYCHDEITANWIVSIGGDLVPWEGAKLKAIPAKDLSSGVRAIFSAPEILKGQPVERILRQVEAQNTGLNISGWTIINSQEYDKGKRIVVRIPPDSWATIETKKNYIFLGFSRVLVTSLEKS